MTMQARRVTLLILIVCILFVAGVAQAEPEFLDRPADDTIRLMTYNPYWNSIFPDGLRQYDRSEEFERILVAVRPDIACIQEVAPGRNARGRRGRPQRVQH